MIAVNYTNVRENLKTYCDQVNDNDETVIITRKDNKNVVLISQNEYNNMLENTKNLKDPNYFIKLYKSLKQLENIDIKEIEAQKRFKYVTIFVTKTVTTQVTRLITKSVTINVTQLVTSIELISVQYWLQKW